MITFYRHKGLKGAVPQLPVTIGGGSYDHGVITERDRATTGCLYPRSRSGWLSGYSYRKSFTYSRASGAVENYQVKILVGESSGATGEDVDCGGHCLATFADLRFTQSDGTTELKYYIEGISGSTPNCLATVWVKLNSVGTSATTFYMYYGKADATTTSSASDTADKYEGFESGTVGVFDNNYNVAYFSASDTQARSGTYSLKVDDVSAGLTASQSSDDNEFWSEDTKRISAWIYNNTSSADVALYLIKSDVNKVVILVKDTGDIHTYSGTSFSDSGINVTLNAWYKYEFLLGSSSYSLYVYNSSLALVGSSTGISYGTSNAVDAIGDVCFTSGTSATGISYLDDVMSMKYQPTEPALGSWGSEESA